MPSSQTDSPSTESPLPPVHYDLLAAAFSFLIPGLGQVYQGRVGKGLLFFFGLYLLFFDGMWMGQWRNVWIPDESDLPEIQILGSSLEGLPKALAYRPQYLGQFWIGVASWPALYQYMNFDRTKNEGPVFGKFERVPFSQPPAQPEDELNDLQRNSNKRWDLGWVYTVIAGVLNLLVIYDALAGPMFREPPAAAAEDAERGQSISPPPAPIPPPQPIVMQGGSPNASLKPPGGSA